LNPVDGDDVVINLGIRDGKVAYIGAEGIRTGAMVWAGGVRETVSFNTGAEARAHGGETFTGCETARDAGLVLADLFMGRAIDDALAVGLREVIAKMRGEVRSDSCVATVLGAVRRAVIDAQVTALAEATVEARALRGRPV
jgi:hypothetical protein